MGRYRNYVLVLLMLIVTACGQQDQSDVVPDLETDIQAVQQTVDDWLNKGIASVDTSRIASYLTPTFGSMEPVGYFEKTPLLEWILTFEEEWGGPFTLEYELHDWHTRVHGDVAWTSLSNDGILSVEGKSPRHLQWTESAVLIRQSDGRWLIDRYHSTYLGDKKTD